MKNEVIQTFYANHKLTHDLLDALTEEQLELKWNRPGLNTFKKHFLEIISVQYAYIDAIKSSNMSFDNVPGVFQFKENLTKDEIKEKLNEADASFKEVVTDPQYEDKKINWYGMELSLCAHISNLSQHDIFHQGMMTMAMYSLNIKIPESWISDWALPQIGENE